MSDFGLTNLTESDFYLSKLPPMTDVPIVSFMNTLEEIDNEYNEAFWLLVYNCYYSMFHNSCKSFNISMHLMEMSQTVQSLCCMMQEEAIKGPFYHKYGTYDPYHTARHE